MAKNKDQKSSVRGDPTTYLENIKFEKKLIGGVDEADVWKKIRGLDQQYKDSEKKDIETVEPIIKKNRKRLLERREVEIFIKRAIGLIIFLVVLFGFIFGFGVVSNNDMAPKLSAGDIMFYYRLDKSPNSTDVILLKKDGETYLGRVIGKPGDTIEIKTDGGVVVNGGEYTEAEIYYETKPYDNDIEYPITLQEREYFVLCDHREQSKDSRFYGVVNQSEIKGRVLTVVRRSSI